MLAATTSPGLLGGAASQQQQQAAGAASTNSSTSPTPSLDSLNGMAGIFLAGGAGVSAADGQDNGNSDSSSGLGSLAVGGGQPTPLTGVAGVMQSGAGGQTGLQGGDLGRSASTSSSTSAGSLASSGLGSSPLGGATLPLFGNGVAPSTGNAPTVINGRHSPPEGSSSGSHSHGAVGSRKSSASLTGQFSGEAAKCPLCCASFHRPKVLHGCFHVFCQTCLEKVQDHPDKITCPSCRKETGLTHGGVAGLLSDTTVCQLLLNGSAGALATLNPGLAQSILNKEFQTPFIQCSVVSCNGNVVAKCMTCHTNLCSNCVNQHLFNNRFGGDGGSHLVCTLGEYLSKGQQQGEVGDMRDLWTVSSLLQQARAKGSEVRAQQKMMESLYLALADSFTRTKHELTDTFQVYFSLVEDRKQQLLRELEADYNQKRMVISQHLDKRQDSVDKLFQVSELTERLFRCSSNSDLSPLKQLLESRVAGVLTALNEVPPPAAAEPGHIGFEANYQAFQTVVRTTGSLVPKPSSSDQVNQARQQQQQQQQQDRARFHNGHGPGTIGKQPPISRPAKMQDQQQGPALNGLVLSSLMDPHSGHHNSGSSGGSGSSGAGNGMNALVQGIATTASLTSMTNGHDHSRSSVSGGLHHSLTNGMNGLHLPSTSSNGGADLPSGVGANNAAGPSQSNGLSGNSALDRMLRFSNSPGGFSSAGSTSSQTIGGFDSLFSKRGGAGSNGFGGGHNDYDKWSNGGGGGHAFGNSGADSIAAAVATYKAINGGNTDSLLDQLPMLQQQQQQQQQHHHHTSHSHHMSQVGGLHSSGGGGGAPTPKSQIKRTKMIYHCKFGEFGVLEGQFTEPSGVCVNAQNDIIVADTNNHRVQIFDKDGRFKFQFGECGKRDGQLLYPNRVAAVRSSGDIIVTERSPTHQVQIYNQYGQFVRKFGANILQHPRGVCVDCNGRIIVVECKVMRVIIFNQLGEVLHKFGCSKHLEFPNGVVVNDRQEIFISDNRAHCVKVFNYEGQYLRQIGGEGLTNYPIGVGINAAGEVTIADNHNNFNLSVFSQDGKLLSALESKVKHAQCFDVALMDDGSVVLASKDYRLYIYRYIQLPPIGM